MSKSIIFPYDSEIPKFPAAVIYFLLFLFTQLLLCQLKEKKYNKMKYNKS